MNFKIRIVLLSAALICISEPTSLRAQSSIATYGSAEIAGFGEGSALIGSSWSPGRLGLGPVLSIQAQTYRYRLGTSHAQVYAVSPSVGLVNTTEVGSVLGAVGYTFLSSDIPNVIGLESGGKNGVFVSAMGNYWGSGEVNAQAIASYGFASEYYWSRFRASRRLAPTATPVYVGGEFVFQGSQPASTSRYQFGPTIDFRLTPEFRVGASGGYRGGNRSAPGSGYARVEFLLLTKLGGL